MIRTSALALLLLASCSAQSRPIEDLVSESHRLYTTLEPDLRKAAEAYLLDYREKGIRYQGKPAMLAQETGRSSQTYQSPDGKNRKDITTRSFELTAEETVVVFRIRDIPAITLQASDRFPFSGLVEITATVLTRTAKAKLSLSPVPAGWVLAEGGSFSEGPVRVVYRNPRTLEPMPLPREPETLGEDAPEEVRARAAALTQECLRAKQTSDPTIFSMKFVYSAPDRTWKVSTEPRKN